MEGFHRGTVFFGIAAAALFAFFAMPLAAEAGVIHNVDGWAWSGQTGWISVNCEDAKPGYPSGDCSPANGNYGLDIDDTGSLSGWAWSTEAGWICFGSTCDGAPGVPLAGTPAEDNFCPGHVPCALYDPNDGTFHGWAYIIGATDETAGAYRGWISLNCTDIDPNASVPFDCGSGIYAVEFDEGATGSDAQFSGYGWNGNVSDTGDGWIKFACDAVRPCAGLDWGVTSSWVNSGWTALVFQEGVYSPPPPPGTPGAYLTEIPFVFTDFSAPEDSTLRCVILMSDGAYKNLTWNIPERQVMTPEYSPGSYSVTEADGILDPSGNPLRWTYASQPPETPFGCEIQASPPIKKAVSNGIAVHPYGFTFTGPGGPLGSDSNRAKFCLEGNLGALDPARGYFLNEVQCDTEGDLAFTLLKAKGVKVEVFCRDNIDDDDNLQKDCDGGAMPSLAPDRNCRGITYLCISHPPAPSGAPPQP